MKYRISTLGCKVNQFETQALESMLAENGIFPAEEDEQADIVILNTCAVTGESGRKSRQALRRMMSRDPDALAAVCGCYSQLEPDKLLEMGAAVVHGSGSKKRFLEDIFYALENSDDTRCYIDDPFKRREFEELSAGAADGRTRAMLKIQDGCVNFCSYCVIPYTRGRLRSLPPDRCAHQAKLLADSGYKELVLTGIEIASYGRDLEGAPVLADAIEAVSAVSEDVRVRLGSLEPTVITESFCERLAGMGNICDHFHLSLQSGSDSVLAAMNRKYDTEVFMQATRLLRRYFPDCGITADLIVGFPGETDEQFRETLDFLEKCEFSSIHIFPYSPRPGTPAAKLPGQLTSAVKTQRAACAQALADRMGKEFLRSMVGRTLPVLFETEHLGKSFGHAPNYALISVQEKDLRGLVKSVKITDIDDKMLVGIIV